MLEVLLLLIACLVAIEWGYAENRLFSDKGMNYGPLILGHFKVYHIWMAILFGTINALASVALFGPFSAQGITVWVWLMLWDTLMLDVTWWVIRYFDFQIRPEYALKLYGEPNAWHLQTDWDNWLGLPLINGTYWWWYVFGGILALLGSALLLSLL